MIGQSYTPHGCAVRSWLATRVVCRVGMGVSKGEGDSFVSGMALRGVLADPFWASVICSRSADALSFPGLRKTRRSVNCEE